ncbi:MAG TPA: family 1 glycosylhydrolase [Anaerolineae bacterium]|nr:family 1 glycosylhydrolase [Anaerolineae bacterium]
MTKPTFYWGVGIENCWMAEHEERNRPPHRLLDIFLLMQHYTQWREDLDLAADLGINVMRYSVPWYKANPEPGVYDWRWISKSLEYLANRRNVIPIIDLLHYGTPLWMENSILNHDYPQRFAEYAAAFARQFKGLVNHYTPYNEPQISAIFGGQRAYWPPYLTGLDGWSKVGLNAGRGMALASQALRAELPDAMLISADMCYGWQFMRRVDVGSEFRVTVQPDERGDFDYQVSTFPACLVYGKVDPSSPFGRVMVKAGSSESELDWFRVNAQLPDIVGHNYYPIEFFDNPDLTLEEALAAGSRELSQGLEQAAEVFGRPVYLTETSAGMNDQAKSAWMHAALQVITDLRGRGIDVVGMNWWPLYEVCRWEYRDSTKTVAESIKRDRWNNGLFQIEEQFDGTLGRIRTGAADAYRDLIAGSGL